MRSVFLVSILPLILTISSCKNNDSSSLNAIVDGNGNAFGILPINVERGGLQRFGIVECTGAQGTKWMHRLEKAEVHANILMDGRFGLTQKEGPVEAHPCVLIGQEISIVDLTNVLHYGTDIMNVGFQENHFNAEDSNAAEKFEALKILPQSFYLAMRGNYNSPDGNVSLLSALRTAEVDIGGDPLASADRFIKLLAPNGAGDQLFNPCIPENAEASFFECRDGDYMPKNGKYSFVRGVLEHSFELFAQDINLKERTQQDYASNKIFGSSELPVTLDPANFHRLVPMLPAPKPASEGASFSLNRRVGLQNQAFAKMNNWAAMMNPQAFAQNWMQRQMGQNQNQNQNYGFAQQYRNPSYNSYNQRTVGYAPYKASTTANKTQSQLPKNNSQEMVLNAPLNGSNNSQEMVLNAPLNGSSESLTRAQQHVQLMAKQMQAQQQAQAQSQGSDQTLVGTDGSQENWMGKMAGFPKPLTSSEGRWSSVNNGSEKVLQYQNNGYTSQWSSPKDFTLMSVAGKVLDSARCNRLLTQQPQETIRLSCKTYNKLLQVWGYSGIIDGGNNFIVQKANECFMRNESTRDYFCKHLYGGGGFIN